MANTKTNRIDDRANLVSYSQQVIDHRMRPVALLALSVAVWVESNDREEVERAERQ